MFCCIPIILDTNRAGVRDYTKRLLRVSLPVALIFNNPDEAVVRIEVALEAQLEGISVA